MLGIIYYKFIRLPFEGILAIIEDSCLISTALLSTFALVKVWSIPTDWREFYLFDIFINFFKYILSLNYTAITGIMIFKYLIFWDNVLSCNIS